MELNKIYVGDCLDIMKSFPDNSVDIIVTSPPYWGQRDSDGVGIEEDPREYLENMFVRFQEVQRIMKPEGIMWVNLGDAYNTPIYWKKEDSFKYSSLGRDKDGISEENSAHSKTRHKRNYFTSKEDKWLKYGNLLALPQRMIIGLCDRGWYYRGEVIWKKKNPLPEGRCRRPHRVHEGVWLFSKTERKHNFRKKPPVKSVWEFGTKHVIDTKHFSKFPVELPLNCIESYGNLEDVVVFDPYSGSGTTGAAALHLGCSYVGIEVDPEIAKESEKYLFG